MIIVRYAAGPVAVVKEVAKKLNDDAKFGVLALVPEPVLKSNSLLKSSKMENENVSPPFKLCM